MEKCSVAKHINGRSSDGLELKGSGELLKVENTVWRQVLDAPSYVAVEALKGEIGSATIEEKDMKITLCYVKHVIKGYNGLQREISLEVRETNRGSQWLRIIRGYMKEL